MGTDQLAALYDVAPIVAHLIGGPSGGREVTVPEDRDTWLMPVEPADLTEHLEDTIHRARTGRPPSAITNRVAVYHRIGVRDDGVRLFRYSPNASTP